MQSRRTKVSSLFIPKTLGLVMGAVIFLSIGSAATVASFNDSGTSAISATAGRITPAPITLESWPYLFEVNKAYVGQTYEKTITITNNGSIPMKYTAALKDLESRHAIILSTVPVTVTVGTTAVYNGNMGAIKVPTQTVPAGSSHALKLTMKPVMNNAIRDIQETRIVLATANLEFTYTN